MAYIVEVTRRCGYGGCGKEGRYELRNWRNETLNWYCKPHAERRLKEQKETEAQP